MTTLQRIPRSFALGCHTVRVRIIGAATMRALDVEANGATADDDPPWGMWVIGESAIFVQRVRLGFNAEQQRQTFWHEYFHALFDVLGRDKLSADEKLVDLCGMLHAQMVQTAKFA